ncbi:MAG: hypothetical protein GY771_16235 [bacterium]|nr:hypothetical protein [bacterium]
MIEPENGYRIDSVERETAWGTATIRYPQFDEAPPLLIEAVCWGDTPADEIPGRILERVADALNNINM